MSQNKRCFHYPYRSRFFQTIHVHDKTIIVNGTFSSVCSFQASLWGFCRIFIPSVAKSAKNYLLSSKNEIFSRSKASCTSNIIRLNTVLDDEFQGYFFCTVLLDNSCCHPSIRNRTSINSLKGCCYTLIHLVGSLYMFRMNEFRLNPFHRSDYRGLVATRTVPRHTFQETK